MQSGHSDQAPRQSIILCRTLQWWPPLADFGTLNSLVIARVQGISSRSENRQYNLCPVLYSIKVSAAIEPGFDTKNISSPVLIILHSGPLPKTFNADGLPGIVTLIVFICQLLMLLSTGRYSLDSDERLCTPSFYWLKRNMFLNPMGPGP